MNSRDGETPLHIPPSASSIREIHDVNIPQALQIALQHHQAGRLADAEALYRQVLAAQPNNAAALHLLGVIAHQLGSHEIAVEWMRKAVAIDPDYAVAHSNLGETFRNSGRLDEAVASFRRALQLQPDSAETHNNLGAALAGQGRSIEAVASFRRALQLKPNYPQAWNNLAIALKAEGKLDEAVAAYRRAFELKPDYPEAHNNLGNALKDLGELDQAIAEFRRALRSMPADAKVHSNLIYALHFHPAYDERGITEEHQRWNRQFSEPLKQFALPHVNNRDPERKLKIGYVSPDFYTQAECYFVIPLLEAHDHTAFEVHAYASVRSPDAMTVRFKKSVDFWHDVRSLSDAALAEQVRKDGIDVLIDLTMHMRDNRLPLFCRQPAPVQVSWLAYPGTTGLPSFGYRFTDPFIEPPHEPTPYSSEDPVRLPDSWCCYHPLDESPDVSPLPALSTGCVTFGSLNNFCKMHEGVLARWARLLGAVEGSRLLMLCPEGRAREKVRSFFQTREIALQRLDLVGKLSRSEYLRLYHRIDLGLDPFPYNGITTTCDALWMGVPVLTLPGATPASRAGLSLLSTAGLTELIANSEDDHLRRATELAADLPRLAALRSTLRPRMQASPLMDAPRFARNIEAAFRAMWNRWCAAAI
jgi:protein O-GlcNAc transferase